MSDRMEGKSDPGLRLESLSIVMPAWNEEDNIEAAIAAAISAGDRYAREVEIIVVDDGSTDATPTLLARAAAAEPRLVPVRHAHRRGYGAALKSGLRSARKRYVFQSDADLQFDLDDLGLLLARVSDHTIVIGYRYAREDNGCRRLLGVTWTALQRRVFGLAVRDANCAFKLYRREVVADIELCSDGAFMPAEMLIRAVRAGYRIVEVPVRHYARVAGSASGGRFGVIATALIDMWRFWRRGGRL